MRQERGKSKFRHKFTTEEVKILKQEFKNSPYPFFETKDELAQQFQCDVSVIDNWFQNKRARSPQEVKEKLSDIRRSRKCQNYMLTGPQDTQTEEASGEQCDFVVQSVGMRSVGTEEYQGATGSGSYNFSPINFTLPPGSEQYYMGGDHPETQESQSFTFSLCVQGQRQMDSNNSPVFPEQQQNNWEYQQPLQRPQGFQERVSLADWLFEHQSLRDLGQQVSFFFAPEHQDQFDPSDRDAAGSQTLLCEPQSGSHQMSLWLHGQQEPADSCTPMECSPVKTHPAYNSQSSGI
ncbi:cytoplasmic polyadenylated homeobox-like protein 2 [Apodemus sylvaticus]|uniref:cytoplasmic polyadenylated homeobox-like protein 2 n=1 Tax=Apodemus sylvaticus TaxID=10129 RepID=UPI0022439286|nr:cytoplasmic polyadenylated homeobox-like protein 2 [Apodemus sylvaticus]